MVFAVIGGDKRQAALVKQLSEDGHETRAFGLEEAGEISCLPDVRSALRGAGYAVLPIPVSAGGEDILNAPLSEREISLRDVFSHAAPGQLFFLGRENTYIKELAGRVGALTEDYSLREEFAVLNAAVTAEGTIKILLENLPVALAGSKCLVIGFGRVGKALAHKLKGLGANVAVSARKPSDAAWAEVLGYRYEDTGKLEGKLSEFDAVINTVPALVLGEKRLSEIRGLCVDLASKPGGVDFETAGRLGVKTIQALGLPGKTAPEAAASAIKHTLYNIIAERSV